MADTTNELITHSECLECKEEIGNVSLDCCETSTTNIDFLFNTLKTITDSGIIFPGLFIRCINSTNTTVDLSEFNICGHNYDGTIKRPIDDLTIITYDNLLNNITKSYRRGSYHFCVYLQDTKNHNKVIAFILFQLYWKDSSLKINYLKVLPKYKKRGLGSLLYTICPLFLGKILENNIYSNRLVDKFTHIDLWCTLTSLNFWYKQRFIKAHSDLFNGHFSLTQIMCD